LRTIRSSISAISASARLDRPVCSWRAQNSAWVMPSPGALAPLRRTLSQSLVRPGAYSLAWRRSYPQGAGPFEQPGQKSPDQCKGSGPGISVSSRTYRGGSAA
jgi:hypothetical protein